MKKLTFLKSFLAMFMLQILLSSVCTINASAANEDVVVSPTSVHCQKDGMLMSDSTNMQDIDMEHAGCAHCDEPKVSLSAQTGAQSGMTLDMIPVLLAIIALPEADLTTAPYTMIEANAPLHSFSLLYQITRRILI